MTQEFVGTKIVTAWPQELDSQPGYAVKYSDGYVSWSPQATFEQTYIAIGHVSSLAPHQQRLIGEKAQLDDKLAKLNAFMGTEAHQALAFEEQHRLSIQLNAMITYARILGERIIALGGAL